MHESFMVGPPADRSQPWRVVVDAGRTGRMSLGDARMPPRSPGPGRHVHTREDEGIYVISGTLTVEVGDERYEAGPETFVFLPRGLPHVFANLSDEEVWTVGLIDPPALTEMFKEQATCFASLEGPPDPQFFLALSERYGILAVDGPPLQQATSAGS